jgi:probable HAF family extracellular repeat protein
MRGANLYKGMNVPSGRPPMSCKPIRTIVAIIGVSSMMLGSAVANAQEENDLIDLGAVAPGLGINNSGQVVLQNYIYSSGTLTAFPNNFTGAGINASGQVVGSVGGQYGGVGVNCPGVGLDSGQGCAIAVYSNGAVTVEPLYSPAGYNSNDPDLGNQGLGINSSGVIVGDWNYTHGLGGAIELDNGAFSTFTFPANSCPNLNGGLNSAAGVAFAINDAGQIVGLLPGGAMCQSEAFLYSQGMYYDIGSGQANAINASGEVTGSLQFGNSSAAFLYSTEGTPMNLGTLPGNVFSTGYGINSAGLVVGTSESTGIPATNVNHAFLYDGVMNDLNSFVLPTDPLKSFVTLTDARGINDSNLIIVNGIDSRDNSNHAYLMQLPLIQVSIKASASTVPAGTPVTLTWTTYPSSASGVTCTATGGSAADGWTGMITLNGTKAVMEAAAGTYAYGLSCTIGSQTQEAHTSVVVTPKSTTMSGGGAFDSLSLIFLLALRGLHQLRRNGVKIIKSQ